MSPWTRELDARLAELWATGLSTPEIGRQLGVSKNAAVGRAHRLNLPGRASPIIRQNPRTPAQQRLLQVRRRVDAQNRIQRRANIEHGQEVKSLAQQPVHAPAVLSATRTCQFIAGDIEPGVEPVKCGRPAIEGKSWCPHHYAVVFVRPKPRERAA